MVRAVIIAAIIWAVVSTCIVIWLGTGILGWSLVILLFVVFVAVAIAWRPIAVRIVRKYATLNKGFTVVDEGRASFVMLGGKPVDAIIQWRGHSLDEEWNVIGGEGSRKYRVWFGAHVFENPLVNARQIFTYNWRRTVVDEQGHMRELGKDIEIDYVPLVPDVYWCKVEEAEDRDLMPLDIELLLTVQVVNPYKALFETGARSGVWLQVVIARTAAEARGVISQKSYRDWMGESQPSAPGSQVSMGNEIKERLETGAANILEEEFVKQYGVRVLDIEVFKITPAGDYQKLTTEAIRARLEGDAAVIKAGLDAAARVALATGDADALRKMVDALREGGDEARILRTLEALEKSPIGGNLFMMMPELRETLRGGAKRRRSP